MSEQDKPQVDPAVANELDGVPEDMIEEPGAGGEDNLEVALASLRGGDRDAGGGAG